ncbi:MAG TPA: hypothetical protein VL404_02610, partial [Candidatus Eisenbacteria bacterium]|nr:hypothetical protein [Candidatus Eisenbacteria bacterium]
MTENLENETISKPYRSRYSHPFRAISLIVLLSFLLQDFVSAEGGTPLWSNVIQTKSEDKRAKADENKLKDFAIPPDSGLARKVAVKSSGDVIINIQDAHSKLGAQESITRILDNLVKNYNLNVVALEGGEGRVDSSVLSSFPVEEVRRKAGEFLMREGRISAGEFYSIVSKDSVRFYGVEDEKLYNENLDSFKILIEKKASIRKELKGLKRAVAELQGKVYSPALREMTGRKLLHKNGDIQFTDYWQYFSALASANGVDYAVYPNLRKLASTVELEKEIDFKKAGAERDALIEELGRKLPKPELEKLVLQALQFKQNKITPGAFHFYLSQLANGAGIDPLQNKNIILYAQYVVLYESIDLIAIFDEVEAFENQLREKLFTTDDERALSHLEHCANILSQLLDTTLSSKDYEFYAKNSASCEVAALRTQLSELSGRYGVPAEFYVDFATLESAIPSARKFYELADRRNKVLLENTVARMKKEGVRVAALVTGGFHSEGISKLMDQGRLSYLVVMPKFDEKSPDRPYIAIITEKPRAFEEQFKDSDFFISSPLAFSDDTNPRTVRIGVGLLLVEGARLSGTRQVPKDMLDAYQAAYRKTYEANGRVSRLTPEAFSELISGARLVRTDGKDAVVLRDADGKENLYLYSRDRERVTGIEIREAGAEPAAQQVDLGTIEENLRGALKEIERYRLYEQQRTQARRENSRVETRSLARRLAKEAQAAREKNWTVDSRWFAEQADALAQKTGNRDFGDREKAQVVQIARHLDRRAQRQAAEKVAEAKSLEAAAGARLATTEQMISYFEQLEGIMKRTSGEADRKSREAVATFNERVLIKAQKDLEASVKEIDQSWFKFFKRDRRAREAALAEAIKQQVAQLQRRSFAGSPDRLDATAMASWLSGQRNNLARLLAGAPDAEERIAALNQTVRAVGKASKAANDEALRVIRKEIASKQKNASLKGISDRLRTIAPNAESNPPAAQILSEVRDILGALRASTAPTAAVVAETPGGWRRAMTSDEFAATTRRLFDRLRGDTVPSTAFAAGEFEAALAALNGSDDTARKSLHTALALAWGIDRPGVEKAIQFLNQIARLLHDDSVAPRKVYDRPGVRGFFEEVQELSKEITRFERSAGFDFASATGVELGSFFEERMRLLDRRQGQSEREAERERRQQAVRGRVAELETRFSGVVLAAAGDEAALDRLIGNAIPETRTAVDAASRSRLIDAPEATLLNGRIQTVERAVQRRRQEIQDAVAAESRSTATRITALERQLGRAARSAVDAADRAAFNAAETTFNGLLTQLKALKAPGTRYNKVETQLLTKKLEFIAAEAASATAADQIDVLNALAAEFETVRVRLAALGAAPSVYETVGNDIHTGQMSVLLERLTQAEQAATGAATLPALSEARGRFNDLATAFETLTENPQEVVRDGRDRIAAHEEELNRRRVDAEGRMGAAERAALGAGSVRSLADPRRLFDEAAAEIVAIVGSEPEAVRDARARVAAHETKLRQIQPVEQNLVAAGRRAVAAADRAAFDEAERAFEGFLKNLKDLGAREGRYDEAVIEVLTKKLDLIARAGEAAVLAPALDAADADAAAVRVRLEALRVTDESVAPESAIRRAARETLARVENELRDARISLMDRALEAARREALDARDLPAFRAAEARFDAAATALETFLASGPQSIVTQGRRQLNDKRITLEAPPTAVQRTQTQRLANHVRAAVVRLYRSVEAAITASGRPATAPQTAFLETLRDLNLFFERFAQGQAVSVEDRAEISRRLERMRRTASGLPAGTKPAAAAEQLVERMTAFLRQTAPTRPLEEAVLEAAQAAAGATTLPVFLTAETEFTNRMAALTAAGYPETKLSKLKLSVQKTKVNLLAAAAQAASRENFDAAEADFNAALAVFRALGAPGEDRRGPRDTVRRKRLEFSAQEYDAARQEVLETTNLPDFDRAMERFDRASTAVEKLTGPQPRIAETRETLLQHRAGLAAEETAAPGPGRIAQIRGRLAALQETKDRMEAEALSGPASPVRMDLSVMISMLRGALESELQLNDFILRINRRLAGEGDTLRRERLELQRTEFLRQLGLLRRVQMAATEAMRILEEGLAAGQLKPDDLPAAARLRLERLNALIAALNQQLNLFRQALALLVKQNDALVRAVAAPVSPASLEETRQDRLSKLTFEYGDLADNLVLQADNLRHRHTEADLAQQAPADSIEREHFLAHREDLSESYGLLRRASDLLRREIEILEKAVAGGQYRALTRRERATMDMLGTSRGLLGRQLDLVERIETLSQEQRRLVREGGRTNAPAALDEISRRTGLLQDQIEAARAQVGLLGRAAELNRLRASTTNEEIASALDAQSETAALEIGLHERLAALAERDMGEAERRQERQVILSELLMMQVHETQDRQRENRARAEGFQARDGRRALLGRLSERLGDLASNLSAQLELTETALVPLETQLLTLSDAEARRPVLEARRDAVLDQRDALHELERILREEIEQLDRVFRQSVNASVASAERAEAVRNALRPDAARDGRKAEIGRRIQERAERAEQLLQNENAVIDGLAALEAILSRPSADFRNPAALDSETRQILDRLTGIFGTDRGPEITSFRQRISVKRLEVERLYLERRGRALNEIVTTIDGILASMAQIRYETLGRRAQSRVFASGDTPSPMESGLRATQSLITAAQTDWASSARASLRAASAEVARLLLLLDEAGGIEPSLRGQAATTSDAAFTRVINGIDGLDRRLRELNDLVAADLLDLRDGEREGAREIGEEARRASADLGTLRDRLGALRDRLNPAGPPAVSPGGAEAARQGGAALGEMRSRLEDLKRRMGKKPEGARLASQNEDMLLAAEKSAAERQAAIQKRIEGLPPTQQREIDALRKQIELLQRTPELNRRMAAATEPVLLEALDSQAETLTMQISLYERLAELEALPEKEAEQVRRERSFIQSNLVRAQIFESAAQQREAAARGLEQEALRFEGLIANLATQLEILDSTLLPLEDRLSRIPDKEYQRREILGDWRAAILDQLDVLGKLETLLRREIREPAPDAAREAEKDALSRRLVEAEVKVSENALADARRRFRDDAAVQEAFAGLEELLSRPTSEFKDDYQFVMRADSLLRTAAERADGSRRAEIAVYQAKVLARQKELEKLHVAERNAQLDNLIAYVDEILAVQREIPFGSLGRSARARVQSKDGALSPMETLLGSVRSLLADARKDWEMNAENSLRAATFEVVRLAVLVDETRLFESSLRSQGEEIEPLGRVVHGVDSLDGRLREFKNFVLMDLMDLKDGGARQGAAEIAVAARRGAADLGSLKDRLGALRAKFDSAGARLASARDKARIVDSTLILVQEAERILNEIPSLTENTLIEESLHALEELLTSGQTILDTFDTVARRDRDIQELATILDQTLERIRQAIEGIRTGLARTAPQPETIPVPLPPPTRPIAAPVPSSPLPVPASPLPVTGGSATGTSGPTVTAPIPPSPTITSPAVATRPPISRPARPRLSWGRWFRDNALKLTLALSLLGAVGLAGFLFTRPAPPVAVDNRGLPEKAPEPMSPLALPPTLNLGMPVVNLPPSVFAPGKGWQRERDRAQGLRADMLDQSMRARAVFGAGKNHLAEIPQLARDQEGLPIVTRNVGGKTHLVYADGTTQDITDPALQFQFRETGAFFNDPARPFAIQNLDNLAFVDVNVNGTMVPTARFTDGKAPLGIDGRPITGVPIFYLKADADNLLVGVRDSRGKATPAIPKGSNAADYSHYNKATGNPVVYLDPAAGLNKAQEDLATLQRRIALSDAFSRDPGLLAVERTESYET